MRNKVLYWIGILGETIGISGFYSMIIILGISYLELIENKSVLMIVGIFLLCSIAGAWFVLRYKGYRQGKYYLEDFVRKKSEKT